MSQYATISDLRRYGMPETAYPNIVDDDLNAGLVAASAEADGYLRGRYKFPLLAYGSQLPMYVCWIATYLILTGRRGYMAGTHADESIRLRYEDAREWLIGVQAKRIHPDITPSDGQSPTYDQPFVYSVSVTTQTGRTASNRGW